MTIMTTDPIATEEPLTFAKLPQWLRDALKEYINPFLEDEEAYRDSEVVNYWELEDACRRTSEACVEHAETMEALADCVATDLLWAIERAREVFHEHTQQLQAILDESKNDHEKRGRLKYLLRTKAAGVRRCGRDAKNLADLIEKYRTDDTNTAKIMAPMIKLLVAPLACLTDLIQAYIGTPTPTTIPEDALGLGTKKTSH